MILVAYLLVDEVRDEPGGRHAARLVVALEAALEVQDEAPQQQLADVRELGVDDGHLMMAQNIADDADVNLTLLIGPSTTA